MKWLVVLLLMTTPAFADDAWEQGVSQERRDQAQALFADGNALFAQQAHQPALEKYRAAIALWDHPLIRFNMAVTLIRLDRILEAADALDAALRFGSAPFSAELYQQAQDYQKLVAGRVGTVEAACDQAGAQVLLDGKPWFACPASQKQRVLTGEHVILAEKSGYLTISRRVVVSGAATASAKLELMPLESVVRLEYPTKRWIPWTVAGVGVAVALGGLGVWSAGRSQMDDFETDFAVRCPMGCAADLSDQPDLARDRDSAKLKGSIGISMLVVGGAVTAGGVVWGVLNRPRRVLPTLEVTPSGVSAQARWQF